MELQSSLDALKQLCRQLQVAKDAKDATCEKLVCLSGEFWVTVLPVPISLCSGHMGLTPLPRAPILSPPESTVCGEWSATARRSVIRAPEKVPRVSLGRGIA